MLDRLRELEAQATPAPWAVGFIRNGKLVESSGHDIVSLGSLEAVAGMWDYEEGGIDRPEDAAFIAEVRNALPLLLDIAEAAQAAREMIEEAADQYVRPRYRDSSDIDALLAALACLTREGERG